MAKHALTQLDRNAVLEEADRTGKVYRLKKGWRRYQKFAGVLCCLLIITIPLGIWIFVAANKARIGLGKDGFVLKMFGTKAVAWNDIEKFTAAKLGSSAMGGGLVGLALASAVSARTEGLRGPLWVKLKDRKMQVQIPAHSIENSVAMAREMERLSGLEIFPPEEPAAAEGSK